MRLLTAMICFFCLIVGGVMSETGYWAVDAAGDWSDSANWTNVAAPPNGTGDVAFITAELTANRAVSIDEDVVLGKLILANEGYTIGSTPLDSPKLIFQNNGEASEFIYTDLDNRMKGTTIYYPIQVEDTLNIDLTNSGNRMPTFRKGFIGDSNAVVNINYINTWNAASISMYENKNFYGSMNLYREGLDTIVRGIRFVNSDSIPAGGSDSVKVHKGVCLEFYYALSQADADVFKYINAGQNIVLSSSATLDSLSNPSALIPQSGLFKISNSSSSTLSHYPDGAPMCLDNVLLILEGYNSGNGYSNFETPGKLTIKHGNRIYIDSKTKAESQAGFDFADFERIGNATLTVESKGNGLFVGNTESNRITFASGMPEMRNGILPPYIIYQYGKYNGQFTSYGEHGIKPFEDYDATNDFSSGGDAIVYVDEDVDLGDEDVECYALFSKSGIAGSSLTIHSGGLILGGSFDNYTVDMYFGEGGNSNAYIFLDGQLDWAKSLRIKGSLHCQDLVKFGDQWILELYSTNNIAGQVQIQAGGLVLRHKYALSSHTNMYMGDGCILALSTDSSEYITGGIESPSDSSIEAYYTADSTLIIKPYTNTISTFNGSVYDEDGRVSVTVDGPGVQVFNGKNDYTGDTFISAGSTLILNGENSATGSVYIAETGIFGGTGEMAGRLTVSNNATLKLEPAAPLRVGSIDFTEASVITVDVSDVDNLKEGAVLQWSQNLSSSLPSLQLTGAPTREDGKYVADYNSVEGQIEVVFAKTYGSLFIIQ